MRLSFVKTRKSKSSFDKKKLQRNKRILEEERQEKIKKRFAQGGDPNASLTCDHNGKPMIVKKLNGNKIGPRDGPRYSIETVDRHQIKIMKRKKQKKFESYAKSLFQINFESK
mmetsp:Transcript_14116/g.14120  ORF Transcript_14116/g.14120 Transcript_14116/m.14120 type:complete len:113 (-) Transcript_14116:693-1031(-)